jgi:3-oxoacyl-[acyl-carrier protein] reductase
MNDKLSDLTGKVALVTGASSGIGRATAEALAARGADVAINYHRNQQGADAARAAIEKAGGRAVAIQADVRGAPGVKALVERAVRELGRVDILVNNAGSLVERLKILELTEARWDEVINLNLKSAFL